MGIISGSIWGSFQGWGSFRGRDHFGGYTVLLANAHLNLNVQALASRHYLATEGYVVHSCNVSVTTGFLLKTLKTRPFSLFRVLLDV